MVTKYIIDNANLALPYLVYSAQKRETITYKELADKIARHHRILPHVLGYIRDEICQKQKLPLLNAIVVNKNTKMPGESFLPDGTDSLTKIEYRNKFEELRDEVFTFDRWDALLKELGLTPIEKTSEDLNKEGEEYLKILERKGTGYGEDEPHLKLKKYVAQNPSVIGLSESVRGKEEFQFISGDVCDVVFENSECFVVEIKNGIRGELIKGIYQAIKYRALMMAEKGKGLEYPVNAFLVAYDIPIDIAEFASKFDIECRIIDRKLVDKT